MQYCCEHLEQCLNTEQNGMTKTVVVVSQTFASSQSCLACCYKNTDVKNLKQRKWNCPSCNTQHDRDSNATKNLENEAIRLLTVGTAGIA